MSYFTESIAPAEITQELIGAWRTLVVHASDSNPFYEPWALLAALKHLDNNQVRLLCVWESQQKKTLMGLFPVERCDRFRAVPLPHVRMWRYEYCYLCTPLVQASESESVLSALFDYLRNDDRLPQFAALNWLPSMSHVNSLFIENSSLPGKKTEHSNVQRACVDLKGLSYDDFLKKLSKRKRKEWARQWRRLNDLGAIDVEVLSGDSTADDFSAAVEEFMVLENTGWKAEQGSSLLGSVSGGKYFRAMMSAGHQLSQTVLLRISIDNRAVGMVAAAISANQQSLYTMKIATDPQLGKYSLGSQVIMQLTQWLVAHTDCQHADSCAAEDHPMINWLWPDRLQLGSVYAPNGNRFASAAINLTDYIKPWLKGERKSTTQKTLSKEKLMQR